MENSKLAKFRNLFNTSFMTRRQFLATGAVGLLVTGCGPEARPRLRIGTTLKPGCEPLFLARHLNALDENQFLVAEYPSPSELMISYQNRALDVVSVTLDDAIRLASHGDDARIVSVLGYSEGADAIMGRPDLEAIGDLRGKVIGFESDASGAYVLARALEKYGVGIDEVTLRSSRADRMNRMFAQAILDAVVTYDPHRAALARAGARSLFDSAEMRGEFIEVLVARSDAIRGFPVQLRKLVEAWDAGLEYLKRNPRAAAEVLAPRDRVTPDQMVASLKLIRFAEAGEAARMLAPGDNTFSELLRKTAEFELKHNLIPSPVNVTALRDDSFVRSR